MPKMHPSILWIDKQHN